jgi:hypothetical protein
MLANKRLVNLIRYSLAVIISSVGTNINTLVN